MEQRKAHILLVAEESEQMNLLFDALVASGHNVSKVTSGAEGLAMVENHSFEVVIVDIGLSDNDQSDFLRLIKEKKPDLPVILITGSSEPGLVGTKFLDGVISRPFRISHIEILIHNILAEKRAHHEAAKGAAVLVVDDDEAFRTMLLRSLQLSGYQALGAPDGHTALALLEEEEIGTVIADINMPLMDGITLMKEIRRRWPTVIVVLITGYYSEGEEPTTAETRPDGFLMKPFKIQSIEKLLKDLDSR
jgi:DNA-binding NtrC family response regulator